MVLVEKGDGLYDPVHGAGGGPAGKRANLASRNTSEFLLTKRTGLHDQVVSLARQRSCADL